MTPEEIAARTRLEQEAGQRALQRFASNPALLDQYKVDFVPAREAAYLPIDPDVKLPAEVQAKIARLEAAIRNKDVRCKPGLKRLSAPADGPIFIPSVVNKEVQERRDAAISALEKQSAEKRGQPPMVVRLRVVCILVDRLLAEGVRFATARDSQMTKLVRERLNA